MGFFFKVQKLQEAAEMVKSRCKILLHENNLIIRNKNKRLEKVSVKRKYYSVSRVHPSDSDCRAVSLPFPKCVPGVALAESLWEFSISS